MGHGIIFKPKTSSDLYKYEKQRLLLSLVCYFLKILFFSSSSEDIDCGYSGKSKNEESNLNASDKDSSCEIAADKVSPILLSTHLVLNSVTISIYIFAATYKRVVQSRQRLR